MNARVHSLLAALYPPAAAAEVERALPALLARRRVNAPDRPLTQRDALLITYADQWRAPGEAPLRTMDRFAQAHLRELISGIHLLPFYPWSSDDGFSVKDYYAVDPAAGGWEDVRRLGESFDLMFDAVFNHASVQGEWFQRFLRGDPEFQDFFVTVEGDPDLSHVVRPRALPLLTEFPTARGPRRVWTTFSADQADLNVKNPRVLLALLDVLLFYAQQGARFIRLDAIAFLWKEPGTTCLHLPQTHAVIQLLRAVLDAAAPGVQLITETNVPHADNIAYFGDGTNEAQLVYNFALPPLTLHALATGDATSLTRWAATLRPPSDRTAFFNFLASHDGIGLNPARGLLAEEQIAGLVERAKRHGGFVSMKHNPDGSQSPYELNISWFDAVNDPAGSNPVERQVDRFLVTQAILLALAGVPGLYVHSLLGSRNDRAAALATGIPRRINRAKFDLAALKRELADAASLRARVFNRYATLLRVRRAHPAFDPHGPQTVLALDRRLFALLRRSPDGAETVCCLHNLSAETVPVSLPAAAGPGGNWTDLLAGTGVTSGSPALRPYQTAWLLQT